MNSHQRRKLNRLKKLIEFKKKIKEAASPSSSRGEALGLVTAFFKDEEKANRWFSTPNPNLGGVSPDQMIALGRYDKLLIFIKTQLAENVR